VKIGDKVKILHPYAFSGMDGEIVDIRNEIEMPFRVLIPCLYKTYPFRFSESELEVIEKNKMNPILLKTINDIQVSLEKNTVKIESEYEPNCITDTIRISKSELPDFIESLQLAQNIMEAYS
jgi:hypothetical protein